MQGLLTHIPKSVSDRVLHAIVVGLKAGNLRLERTRIKLLFIKELSAIDRANREHRLRLYELGIIPDTPPPPPFLSYSLIETLVDDVIDVLYLTPGTGLLNGALETSFVDRGQPPSTLLPCTHTDIAAPSTTRPIPQQGIRRA